MKLKIVNTSLRIEENDWLQLRAMAAELGVSVNEYVRRLIKGCMVKNQLASELKKDRKDLPVWGIAGTGSSKKGYELSDDDEIIYG